MQDLPKKKLFPHFYTTDNKCTRVINSVCSSSCAVISGVPQVGPTLFLLYINDLTKNIKSSVRLFADDCLIY